MTKGKMGKGAGNEVGPESNPRPQVHDMAALAHRLITII